MAGKAAEAPGEEEIAAVMDVILLLPGQGPPPARVKEGLDVRLVTGVMEVLAAEGVADRDLPADQADTVVRVAGNAGGAIGIRVVSTRRIPRAHPRPLTVLTALSPGPNVPSFVE